MQNWKISEPFIWFVTNYRVKDAGRAREKRLTGWRQRQVETSQGCTWMTFCLGANSRAPGTTQHAAFNATHKVTHEHTQAHTDINKHTTNFHIRTAGKDTLKMHMEHTPTRRNTQQTKGTTASQVQHLDKSWDKAFTVYQFSPSFFSQKGDSLTGLSLVYVKICWDTSG